MPGPVLNKTIVAVHGIGDQNRFATSQQVLTQFARYHDRAGRAVPLGQFHNDDNCCKLSFHYRPGKDDKQPKQPLTVNLTFAEGYWADIPREMVKEGFLLEDARRWARTIVERYHLRSQAENSARHNQEGVLATCKLAVQGEAPGNITREKIEQVLTEMLQTLVVLDKIFFLAGKLKLFTFDLNKLLLDFLDDVQVVAEFQTRRNRILNAFSMQMEKAYEANPQADIYIIAHSEGTVVSLFGLLEAAHKNNNERPKWLERVRGYMTIGSPIDKHIELWPEIFTRYENENDPPQYRPAEKDKIEWRNYYDFGDPVGFELDEARRRIDKKWGCSQIFNFKDDDDYGFARYSLPGKAHNDYWTDDAVFGHFIQNVVYKYDSEKPSPPEEKDYSKGPGNKPWKKIISHFFPYAGALAVLFCAVLMIYKAVFDYTGPGFPLNRSNLLRVTAVTLLLAGLTFVTRIVRLTKPGFWWLIGFGGFVLSATSYRLLLGQGAVLDHQPGILNPGLVGTASVVVIFSLLAGLLFPSWGMRTLLYPGFVAVLTVIGKHLLKDADRTSLGSIVQHLQNSAGTTSLWSVVLTTALFFFLWWLVALVFDLVFVWHRYIRYSVKNLKGGSPSFSENPPPA